MRLQNKKLYIVACAAAVISFVLFLPALFCDFVNFDDPQYVIENTGIRSLGADFWFWSFFTIPLNYWTPLLWISFALDYHFWGLNPLGYHLTNIVLHSLTVFLFAILADKVYSNSQGEFTGDSSSYRYPGMILVAALMFAIHPARVESVVWVTERKDVLNGVFTFGFLIYYLKYLQKKGDSPKVTGAGRDYFICLFLFILSLLVKPSGLLLPLALLLLDWYPLKRFSREKKTSLILEKVPFMVCGTVIISVSIIFRMNQGGFNKLADFPFMVRTVAAGNALVEYFFLMLVPINILPYEILPRAVPILFIYKAIAAGLFLVGTVLAARRFPGFAVSVLFFAVTIVPALHFITDGYQTVYSPRLTYLPCIAACILAAPALMSAGRKVAFSCGRYGGYLAAGLLAALFVFYAGTTVSLIGDWKNSGVMWSKVIELKPFDKAYFFRGSYLAEKGEYLDAINDYSTCIELATPRTLPDIHNVYAFRADALVKAGYYLDALDDFTTAISLYPHKLYYYHRGEILRKLGRLSDADSDFAAAGEEKGRFYWMQK